jgi:hypothetical protein
MRKLRFEILLGTILLCVSVSSIVWVYSMVCSASEVGTMERADIKQWSSVLILLSVTTLFMGSVGGYIIGKYLHVSNGNPNFQAITCREAREETSP